jgi:hypothetical protein
MSKLRYVLTLEWLTAKIGGVFALVMLAMRSVSDALGYAADGRWIMLTLAACGGIGFALLARDLASSTVIERDSL